MSLLFIFMKLISHFQLLSENSTRYSENQNSWPTIQRTLLLVAKQKEVKERIA